MILKLNLALYFNALVMKPLTVVESCFKYCKAEAQPSFKRVATSHLITKSVTIYTAKYVP